MLWDVMLLCGWENCVYRSLFLGSGWFAGGEWWRSLETASNVRRSRLMLCARALFALSFLLLLRLGGLCSLPPDFDPCLGGFFSVSVAYLEDLHRVAFLSPAVPLDRLFRVLPWLKIASFFASLLSRFRVPLILAAINFHHAPAGSLVRFAFGRSAHLFCECTEQSRHLLNLPAAKCCGHQKQSAVAMMLDVRFGAKLDSGWHMVDERRGLQWLKSAHLSRF